MAKTPKNKTNSKHAPKRIDWDYYLIEKKLHLKYPSRAAFAAEMGVAPTSVKNAMRTRGLL